MLASTTRPLLRTVSTSRRSPLAPSLRQFRIPSITTTSNVCMRRLSSTAFNSGTMGNLIAKSKALIGPHTVILSHDDEHSVQMRENLWVELQKVGIQSVFSSIPEPVASTKGVAEAAYFVQRSGARSVIAVGNGALCDVATSLRKSIERGASSLENGTDTTAPGRALAVLAVPTNASPAFFHDTALLLNDARDVFSPIAIRPPETVLFDTSYSRKNVPLKTFTTTLAYLFSELLDSVYCAEYTLAQHVATHTVDASTIAMEMAKIRSVYTWHLPNLGAIKCLFEGAPSDTDLNSTVLMNAFQRISALRRDLALVLPGTNIPINQAHPVQMRTAYSILKRAPFRDYQDHASVSLLLLLQCFHITKSGSGSDYTALRNALGVLLSNTSSSSMNTTDTHTEPRLNNFEHDEVFELVKPFCTRLHSMYLSDQAKTYKDWKGDDNSTKDVDEFRIAEEMTLEQRSEAVKADTTSTSTSTSSTYSNQLRASASKFEFIKGDMFGDYCAETEIA